MNRSRPAGPEIDDSCCDTTEDIADTPAESHVNPFCLVGEIAETATARSEHRAVVRWRAVDGTLHERSLSVVKGLAVETGDLVLLQRPGNWPEWVVTNVVAARTAPEPLTESEPNTIADVDLKVDGKRVEIEGRNEVVLRCGEASITLRRNGRVVIRGAYIETRSRGTNRIKGGVVLIN